MTARVHIRARAVFWYLGTIHMLIAVSARDEMIHDGIVRAAGEVFEVSPLVAAALTYQRKVVLIPKLGSEVRLVYRRRDLRAAE